jgi:thymidylate synthase
MTVKLEEAYLQTMQDVLRMGAWQVNERTGERCCTLPGAMTRFDISTYFPAVTTKKLAFNSAVGELVGFLRGKRSAAAFRALGCKVWDQNANENEAWLANPFRLGEDDLGDIYGVQWRRWPAYKLLDGGIAADSPLIQQLISEGWARTGDHIVPEGCDVEDYSMGNYEHRVLLRKEIDQLGECIRKLILNPSDRRILFHGWNPAKLDEVALPACHLLYQFLPSISTKELSLCIYIRSWDTFLGGPFNITEGAVLLGLVARLTGFAPKLLTIFSGDTHVYEKHLPMVREQLSRPPIQSPTLEINDRVPLYSQLLELEGTPEKAAELAIKWLDFVVPSDFWLEGYIHHPALVAPMAV